VRLIFLLGNSLNLSPLLPFLTTVSSIPRYYLPRVVLIGGVYLGLYYRQYLVHPCQEYVEVLPFPWEVGYL
jgi:hypothetical protein